ncbi:MAG TPA: hypothetical protein VKE74_34500 [Gemmataceae bacterium]|nr:hypothetical protein [Gemmataceae bacterium]
MPDTDFTLEKAEADFGFSTLPGLLFPGLTPLPVPDWLTDLLTRTRQLFPFVSEKSRSESVVLPILLAVRDTVPGPLAVFSGQRLDVDPKAGLVGECDYILARTQPVPRLRNPLAVVLEAKKADIEPALGQCAAQMEGARRFNQQAGQTPGPVFGCVTNADVWQFLRLDGPVLMLNEVSYYASDVGLILAAFAAALAVSNPVPLSTA